MSGVKLFGTDGIRGVANAEPMTPEFLVKIGKAAASGWGGAAPSCVIGRDTRISGPMLEAALVAGMAACGADVYLGGEIPTPAVALLTRLDHADAGSVISASHNPFTDNGVKFFGRDGFKAPDSEEAAIEALVKTGAFKRVQGARLGRIRPIPDASERYVRFLIGTLPSGSRLDGMPIVLDCAHGAAYQVGPRVFQELGARLTTIGAAPDGVNINLGHGALHPERLQASVRETGAAMGVALDGDADRVLLVDGSGAVVDGDEALAILADARLKAGNLPSRTVVGTVMSNMGLEIALKERDVCFVRAAVGDRYVVEEMRRHGAILGGEPSGHLVLLEHHTTGDGLLAALRVCQIMRETGRDLAQLRRVMSKLPQVIVNVQVSRRGDLRQHSGLNQTVAEVEERLGTRGRVLVRPSGTEPVVRVMVEGDDESRVRAYADEIAVAVAAAHRDPG